jgi:hypothetical protein
MLLLDELDALACGLRYLSALAPLGPLAEAVSSYRDDPSRRPVADALHALGVSECGRAQECYAGALDALDPPARERVEALIRPCERAALRSRSSNEQ